MKKFKEFLEKSGLSSSEDQLVGIILRIEALIDGLKLENVNLRERIHELEGNQGKDFNNIAGT